MEVQGIFTNYMCIAKSKRDNKHTESTTACLVKKKTDIKKTKTLSWEYTDLKMRYYNTNKIK